MLAVSSHTVALHVAGVSIKAPTVGSIGTGAPQYYMYRAPTYCFPSSPFSPAAKFNISLVEFSQCYAFVSVVLLF
jgi:hypothetical protein